MKNEYMIPLINITKFSAENIVTDSVVITNTDVVADVLDGRMSGAGTAVTGTTALVQFKF